jgi:hypothetical protein
MKNDRKIPKMWASVGNIVGKKCTCLITEYIGNPRNNRPRVSLSKKPSFVEKERWLFEY